MTEKERARLSDVLLKAGRAEKVPADAPIGLASAPAMPDQCVGQVAKECEPMRAPSVAQQRARLYAAHEALEAVRDDFRDFRAYEDVATVQRHVMARLGELELNGR